MHNIDVLLIYFIIYYIQYMYCRCIALNMCYIAFLNLY